MKCAGVRLVAAGLGVACILALASTCDEPEGAKTFRECIQKIAVPELCAGKVGLEVGNGA